MTCSAFSSFGIFVLFLIERFSLPNKTTTKFTKRNWFVRVTSCDSMDHPYPSEKKTSNRIRDGTGICDHLVIRSHLIVRLSTRDRFTSNPIPGWDGAVIVPREVTVTGGSIMSSSQPTQLAET